MNSDNPSNVSLQAALLTMMSEKIDALTNRISNMQKKSDELKQSVDTLTARIDEFELSAKEVKKKIEVKSNDADNEHDTGAPEEKAAKETQISSPVVEAKKEPEAAEPPQGFGAHFDKKEGEWDCQTCYLRNKPSNDACASCGIGKDGKEATSKPSASAFKPTTFSSPADTQFSFGINKATPSFGIKHAPAVPSPAKTAEPSTTESKPAETKSLFGNIKPITVSSSTSSQPAGTKSLFGSTKPIIFSSAPSQLAATTTTSPFASPSSFGGKTAADGTQPKSLFGGPTSSFSANKPPVALFGSGTGFLSKQPADSLNNTFSDPYDFYGEVEEIEDSEEENEDEYDEALYYPKYRVLFRSNCKLTLDVAYKTPFAKNSLAEVYENSKIRISIVDNRFYNISFYDGESGLIFPHYIQNDSVYKKNGKMIEFVARDERGVEKYVTCEFENAAAADGVLKLLVQCRDNS